MGLESAIRACWLKSAQAFRLSGRKQSTLRAKINHSSSSNIKWTKMKRKSLNTFCSITLEMLMKLLLSIRNNWLLWSHNSSSYLHHYLCRYLAVFMYKRGWYLWAQKADHKQKKSMTLDLPDQYSGWCSKSGGGILFAISYSLHFIDGDRWRIVCICVMWCRERHAGIYSGVQRSVLVKNAFCIFVIKCNIPLQIIQYLA